jgi:hypothetical protein
MFGDSVVANSVRHGAWLIARNGSVAPSPLIRTPSDERQIMTRTTTSPHHGNIIILGRSSEYLGLHYTSHLLFQTVLSALMALRIEAICIFERL